MYYSATYDPADDKLRLSATSRLDKEEYARVKAAGFQWAPKQGVFYAVWSPSREDLCLEFAGQIDDEDKSLMDRAEERAERFEGYSENRERDAELAHKAVERITDGIPLGQPILVGHHSERHARKDAERIENGMRKAVKAWETAKYWEGRAAAAIAHARYLERPDVRARRIKTLEAEVRSLIADYTPHTGVPTIMQEPWNWHATPDLSEEARDAERQAAREPHCWVGPHGRGGRWVPVASLERIKAGNQRSIEHCNMRLVYERAMLASEGGLTADQYNIEVGGKVKRRGEWFVVVKINRRDAAILSVTVVGHWCSTIPYEEIQGYEPPAAGAAEKVAKVMKQAPLCNFRLPGCVEMTMADWKNKTRWSDSNFVADFNADGTYAGFGKRGVYRLRTLDHKTYTNRIPVFLTDQKITEPPKIVAKPEPVHFDTPTPEITSEQVRVLGQVNRIMDESAGDGIVPERRFPTIPYRQSTIFDAMKETLKVGVQIAVAPQLFPTPPELAARMVEESGLEPMDWVLEPSAGTGNILTAIRDISKGAPITAVEINGNLADGLRKRFDIPVVHGDFLEQNGNLGKFDRILMNPPFEDGADIKHIRHAMTFLKPGGRLVAICAGGPRQKAALEPIASLWEPLPADTFKQAGTGVSTVLLVIEG